MSVRLLCGDALEVMRTLADASVDAVVTDPPYGLNSMGWEWDHGIPGEAYWREALRVARPGAHLLAFGGTRTFHRLVCAIEDAAWEIRDCVMWAYGSGFPKSLDVSKAIDKAAGAERAEVTRPATKATRQWQGWGTGLKPAWEPIIVARKPLDGTVAENVQRHGTGAINVDGCRIGTDGGCAGAGAGAGARVFGDGLNGTFAKPVPGLGRWPANLIHDGSDEVLAGFPQRDGATSFSRPVKYNATSYQVSGDASLQPGYADSGSAARFFYCAKASRAEREAGLESLPERPKRTGALTHQTAINTKRMGRVDTTGHNNHPTVKPVALMRWLVRLVTPPDGLVLDPFAGSGTTGVAAMLEGFEFIGIDLKPEYVEMARRRIGAVAPLFSEGTS